MNNIPPAHRVLSVRQPWAHLIVTGVKRIENRTWTTRYRGPLLIHAGRLWDDEPIDDIEQRHGITIPRDLPLGGVVGVVELVDVVRHSDDPYFVGPWGLVLVDPRPLPFVPVRGKLGIFTTQAAGVSVG